MQKKSLETILYSTAGVLVMLVILIAFNFIAGTVRASFGVYNDRDDIDRLAAAVEACREMFSR